MRIKFVTERLNLADLFALPLAEGVVARVPAVLVQILVLVIVVVISPIPIGSGAT
jgi:hypothetical protein